MSSLKSCPLEQPVCGPLPDVVDDHGPDGLGLKQQVVVSLLNHLKQENTTRIRGDVKKVLGCTHHKIAYPPSRVSVYPPPSERLRL